MLSVALLVPSVDIPEVPYINQAGAGCSECSLGAVSVKIEAM
jgi:hypothetical protein